MFIEHSHPELSIREQCAMLGLNHSSVYYKHQKAEITNDMLNLMRLVDEVYTQYPFFGTRQMSQYLTLHHEAVKRHQVRAVYEKLGLRSLAPGPHTSKPHPEHKVYSYLLRDVDIISPMQVWSSDITYICLRRGFIYLMAIIDWYSRFVLDWQLSISLEDDFCIETLAGVLAYGKCDIFNTDQGSQFTSHGFTGFLKEHDILISMDGKGRALDNIFVERLWCSVKYECIYLQEWESVAHVREALKAYFQFYNYKRPHQALGGMTPYHVHTRVIH